MKLVMDEKVKHRLVGLAVIISLGAIFAPALIKKSNQGAEGNFSVNVKLPPKPLAPDVVVTDEQEVFKTIKVSRVDIPSDDSLDEPTKLANAEPIRTAPESASTTKVLSEANTSVSNHKIIPTASVIAAHTAANSKAKQIVAQASKKQVRPIKPVVAKLDKSKIDKTKPVKASVKQAVKPVIRQAAKRELYALQLASFAQVSNAQSLVNRLRSRGYKATYVRVGGRSGSTYKVYVGHSPDRNQVMRLKTQLAQAMQLNGFVVNTGVS